MWPIVHTIRKDHLCVNLKRGLVIIRKSYVRCVRFYVCSTFTVWHVDRPYTNGDNFLLREWCISPVVEDLNQPVFLDNISKPVNGDVLVVVPLSQRWLQVSLLIVLFTTSYSTSHIKYILYAGVSRYCVVDKFLRVGAKCFAFVRWLSTPHYPYYPNPLVVQVCMPRRQHGQPCRMLPVEEIEPTSVSVSPHEDGVNFFVIRSKGTDRTTFTRAARQRR